MKDDNATTHIDVDVEDERASVIEPGGRTNVPRRTGRGDVESCRASPLRPRIGEGRSGSGLIFSVLVIRGQASKINVFRYKYSIYQLLYSNVAILK